MPTRREFLTYSTVTFVMAALEACSSGPARPDTAPTTAATTAAPQPTETIPTAVATTAATPETAAAIPPNTWGFTSIDTMKISRDRAREGVSQTDIDYLVSEVAKTGATHVGIGTPYDEEFLPALTQWVTAARNNNLNVWFRGNFSGWEGWFEHQPFTDTNEHHEKTKAFITAHVELFQEGDIFTSAPEPENGYKGGVIGPFWDSEENKTALRNFLIESYNICKEAFTQIGMADLVKFGYFSMNGDVAKALTNEVVEQIGNVVVIDHYVQDSEKMSSWIAELHQLYPNAEVVIGEFGAPIPDLNGEMDEEQQAAFIELLFQNILLHKVAGLNYWSLKDGSTALLNGDGSERLAYEMVKKYYTANQS